MRDLLETIVICVIIVELAFVDMLPIIISSVFWPDYVGVGCLVTFFVMLPVSLSVLDVIAEHWNDIWYGK